VRYDNGLPMKSNRFGAMERGEVDMIVDEAVRGWINTAAGAGMRVLPFEDPMLTKLEALGLRRAVQAAIVEALSDDPDIVRALGELVDAVLPRS